MQMDRENNAEKLLSAFIQFQKVDWDQKIIPGYKTSELKVLICIKNKRKKGTKGMMVSEISQFLRVTSPTVTQLVNGLEKKELVKRNLDKTDRRVVRIQLTNKGLKVAKQTEANFIASFKGLVDYLGEEQSDLLANLLMKTVTYFNQQGIMKRIYSSGADQS